MTGGARRGGVFGAGVVVLGVLLGCREERRQDGPGDAALQLVATLRQVHGDPAVGQRAVGLLARAARENLEERARRASALSGRTVLPGEMLVPSFFSMHLNPVSHEERIEGDRAEVTFVARDGRRSVVRLVREETRWVVALELPPLSPIRQRERDESEL